MFIAHVAAKDLHSGDAQAQGEKRLIHGGGDDIAQAVLFDAVHGGQQVELHAFGGAGQGETVDGQHKDKYQQRQHHALGNAFQTVLQAKAAHHKAGQHHNFRPDGHFPRGGQEVAKDGADRLCGHALGEGASEELEKVAHHPAGDRGVVHHQQAAAQQAEPAVDMPLLTGLFQCLIA